MITLYTSYYKDNSAIRQAELEFCLQKNIDNPLIDKIVLICEEEPPQHPKIHPLFEGRPTYKRFYDLIRIYASHSDISIVANSDIYFDDTLGKILLNGKTAIALSRYDVKPGCAPKLHNCSGSQDTWIFMGKVLPVRYSDFHLGIPGCDNRMAWELHRAGYKLINPASWLKSYHYHPSDLHNYHDDLGVNKPHLYIAKPYLFVELT